jgi:cellulose synthase/poly-beta-1,6-N-acetylglucosamine synthase-like glycosyltransferase
MLFTDPFSTVTYHWNWFDLVLLIPYFAVMIVLSIYGVHRYTLCYIYRKYRKNYDPHPPEQFAELPRVTVQLPIFNEQFVIDRLLESICAMEYPREKLEIQVLDDSTDETTQVASALVALRRARSSYRLYSPDQSLWI